jgi:hypothetical protein
MSAIYPPPMSIPGVPYSVVPPQWYQYPPYSLPVMPYHMPPWAPYPYVSQPYGYPIAPVPQTSGVILPPVSAVQINTNLLDDSTQISSGQLPLNVEALNTYEPVCRSESGSLPLTGQHVLDAYPPYCQQGVQSQQPHPQQSPYIQALGDSTQTSSRLSPLSVQVLNPDQSILRNTLSLTDQDAQYAYAPNRQQGVSSQTHPQQPLYVPAIGNSTQSSSGPQPLNLQGLNPVQHASVQTPESSSGLLPYTGQETLGANLLNLRLVDQPQQPPRQQPTSFYI